MLNVAIKWSASGFLWQEPSVSEQPRSRQSLARPRQPQPPDPTRRDLQINVVFMLGTGAVIECCRSSGCGGPARASRSSAVRGEQCAHRAASNLCGRNPNALGPSFLQAPERASSGFYTSLAPQCAIHRRRRRNHHHHHHHHHRAFAGAAARGAAERHPPPWSQPQRQQRRRC